MELLEPLLLRIIKFRYPSSAGGRGDLGGWIVGLILNIGVTSSCSLSHMVGGKGWGQKFHEIHNVNIIS